MAQAQSSDPSGPAPAANPVWLVTLAPKASYAVGAQSKQDVGGFAEFKYEPNSNNDPAAGAHTRLRLDLNGDNTLTQKPGSSVRLHEYDGTLSYLYYLNPRFYLEGIGQGYHNSSLSLYLQQSYGGGGGTNIVFDHRRQAVELSADVRYIAEHFYGTGPSQTFAGVRLTEEYTACLGNPARCGNPGSSPPPVLTINMSYIPAIEQAKAWQARGRATLTVPIGKRFSMKFSVADDYMENTPRKNYSSSSAAIAYTFSK